MMLLPLCGRTEYAEHMRSFLVPSMARFWLRSVCRECLMWSVSLGARQWVVRLLRRDMALEFA